MALSEKSINAARKGACVHRPLGHAWNLRRQKIAAISGPTGYIVRPFNAHQIIDFMAQIYAEAFADASNRISIPRKMFQREMTTEAKTLDDLAGAGDFFTLPDSELTETLIDNSLGRAENADLLMIGDGNRQSIRTWQLSE